MGTCLERNQEKDFLNIINQMLKELDQNLKFSMETLHDMAVSYAKLTEEEQQKCLDTLYEIFSEDYDVIMYMFATLLKELKDKKILSYIEKIFLCREYPLWERLNDRSQFRIHLFTNLIYNQEYEEYGNLKQIYENFLSEIQEKMNCSYPYIPLQNRRKKIIIVMSDVISIYHAPTKRLRFIYRCYQNMGYDVTCFVCHLWGVEGRWDYCSGYTYNCNFMAETGSFSLFLDGVKIEGFNLILKAEDYTKMLEKTLGMIWEEKPEFVLEIGNETILAGLCRPFTTLVTMGCTKSLPVTNAPIIATAVGHSKKEQKLWEQILEPEQVVLKVRHTVNSLEETEDGVVFTKESFGIPKDAFVVIIAGNRLDEEIKDDFLAIMYQILDLKKTIVIAVIGECPGLKARVSENERADRIFFLGMQEQFRKAIAVGDVFLNPPRQGGGTGALFAIMEGVPVITLDNCDVEANAGEEFVCQSVEEMPALVHQYSSDFVFMEKQKEYCRKHASAEKDVNSEENFRKLNQFVKEYTAKQEENKNDTF